MMNSLRSKVIFFGLVICSFQVFATEAITRTIPVTITDAAGLPVVGVTKSDLSIESPQNLSMESLEEVLPATVSRDGVDSRAAFVLFDLLEILPEKREYFFSELLEMLSQIAQQHSPVTVLFLGKNGLKLVHGLEEDPGVLAKAVEILQNQSVTKGQTVSDPAVAEKIKQLKDFEEEWSHLPAIKLPYLQLQAFQRLATLLGRSPARKPLIWIESDFPLAVENGLLGGQEFDRMYGAARITAQYEDTIEALNRAHISVYPIKGQFSVAYYAWNTELGLALFASRTGGRVIAISKHLSSSITEAVQDCIGYYSMTLKDDQAKVRAVDWKKLRIRSTRTALKIRAPDGFFRLPH